MKMTQNDIEYVAKLSKIHLSDEQKERLAKDMSAIIAFANKLSEIDTTGIMPEAHAIPVQNVFRKDEVKPSYSRDELLKNAPEKQAGCFSVPKILE